MIIIITIENDMLDIYKRTILSADRILSLTLSALYISTSLLVLYYVNLGTPANPKSFHFFWSLLVDKPSISDMLKAFFMIALTIFLLHGFSAYEFNKSKETDTDKTYDKDIIVKVVSSIICAFAAVVFLSTTIIAVIYSPLLTTPTDSPLLNAMLYISAYFILVRITMLLTDWFLSEPRIKQEDA